MESVHDLEMQFEEMDIENEENEELVFDESAEEDVNRFELCVVGKFLTEKTVNSKIMKTKMADIWRRNGNHHQGP